MSYNNVDKSTGNLIPVAGGTLYADLPVGAWIKWDDQTNLPDGYLKAGDTITQADYPELYAKYGSTVPYKADDSELSDWEDITIGTSNVTMAYDGFVIGKWSLSNNRGEFTVNDTIVFSTANSASGVGELEIPVKKGDTIKQTGSTTTASLIKARFYKKSLIVKAKSTGAPTDIIEGVKDALGAYSTTETAVGTWIDGKPIYRKVITGLSVSFNNMSWFNICSTSLFPNIERPILAKGFTAGSMIFNFPEVNIENGYVKAEIPTGGSRTLTMLLLEYTKTTD